MRLQLEREVAVLRAAPENCLIDQQHPDLEDLDLELVAYARLSLWEHGREN